MGLVTSDDPLVGVAVFHHKWFQMAEKKMVARSGRPCALRGPKLHLIAILGAPSQRGRVGRIAGVVAATFACAGLACADDTRYGALSVAPDGIYSGTVRQGSRRTAEREVLNECRAKSNQADKCVVESVSSDGGSWDRRYLTAWHCSRSDTEQAAIIMRAGKDVDEHRREMMSDVRKWGYSAEECGLLMMVTPDDGYDVASEKHF